MPGVNSPVKFRTISHQPGLTFFQRLVDVAFRPMTAGRLSLRLPDGRVLSYGTGEGGITAEIDVQRNDFFRKCVFFGDVGFGESYVDGDWETPDITAVISWMIRNVDHHPTLMGKTGPRRTPVNILKILNNLLNPIRRNSRQGSLKNIKSHYDLGNHFYALFLDESMAYSSAYFRKEDDTLQRAQAQKFEELCRKLRLQSGDRLLEIGSGWGGFAIYAARNFGCQVTTVTVSPKQWQYARERVFSEGLQGRVSVELKDYRDLGGQFDKIVSIEMLEAVGHDFYKDYFEQCHRLLTPRGLLGLQVILSPDHRYESFRKNIDWIQKHIFPGSLLPSLAVLHQAILATGDLNLLDFEDITAHYVKTLRMWHDNFNQRLEDVRAAGFDSCFIRKWNYYLCYCEAAFATRNISVAQMVFSRPNNLSLSGS